MAEDLSWSMHTASVVGKAQQCLLYLKKLIGYQISKPLLVNFYNCAISSVLTYGFLVRYSSSSKEDKQVLQCVVKTAQKNTGMPLPEITTIYTTRTVTTRTVRMWTPEAEEALRNCFDSTDWTVLQHSDNLEEITDCTADYLNLCMGEFPVVWYKLY